MFKDSTIKNLVMKTIEERIEQAQVRYESGVKDLEAELEGKKADLAQQLIKTII